MGRRPRIYTEEEKQAIQKEIDDRAARKAARVFKQHRHQKNNYQMFVNGFFNCDFVPFGYNYHLGYCEQSSR